jgi:hypothetical protein
MRQFSLSKDEWYTLRDDRTKRVDGISGFEDFSLGITIDQTTSFASQVMAVIALNILSRWCRKITIEMQVDSICLLPYKNGEFLSNVLGQMMSDADPYGEFVFGSVDEDRVNEILIIGDSQKAYGKPHVWINGSGWISGIGYSKTGLHSSITDCNIVGPAFASSLGVAEIFKCAVGLPPKSRYHTYYSLYDFSKSNHFGEIISPSISSRVDFGRVFQIGCGAVGSSVDFLLSLTNWNAVIDLIDFDEVKVTDSNRSLTFNAFDAIDKKGKVDVCADLFKTSAFIPSPFMGGFSQFVSEGRYLDTPPDLILCLANEENIWSTIQNNYPPLTLHATTTPNWGINFGRHIPKKEWCIMCRFSKEIKSFFAPPCSEGIISNNDEGVTIHGVLPFLSTTAAILILAEMAKMNLNDYPMNDNFIQFSHKESESRFIKLQRRTDAKCVCKDQIVYQYPREIRNSKFWKLVES